MVRLTSIRSLLAFAVQKGMLIHQMDVVTAFLNGHLEEEIYMTQPPGYVPAGKEDLFCLLQRSLYGLKQSPRCWHSVFCTYMKEMGFVQSKADSCVFTMNKPFSIVTVYVDDLILFTEDTTTMQNLKNGLTNRFKMSDMGPLHYILGVSIIQDSTTGGLWLHQSTYIDQLLEKYRLVEAKPVSTPLDVNVKLVKEDGVSKSADQKLYQSIVGSLLYVAIASRPDIQHAVSTVSKFSANPSETHLTAAKRILRYLKETKLFGLRYLPSSVELHGYSDADYGGDLSDRHSTSGHCFLLASGVISWHSKKQSVVTLSTAEAEYVALSHATQEVIWLKRLFSEVGMRLDSVLIKDDSQAAIAMAKNPIHHAKSKHIDIRYHFLREELEKKTFKLEYCNTKEMVADSFTKSLPRIQFQKLRSLMGIQDMERQVGVLKS